METSPQGDIAQGRRTGAPKGNRNAQTHGLRSSKLPEDCRTSIEGALFTYRKALQAECKRVHGRVSVVHAGHISTAVRCEKRAVLMERWMRVTSGLTLVEKRDLLTDIAAASESRDKAVARLNLDTTKPGGSVVDDLYGHPAESPTLHQTNGRDASCDESASDDPSIDPADQNALQSESRVSEDAA